jgi:hypothetical protein
MQEGPPSLAGRRPPFDHVLGDARLRDLEPELEQFAVDAWRPPKRILYAHPADQCAQLRVYLRSPSLGARLPTPVTAKAGPVPTHERLGPDDCENLQDKRKPTIQLDQEPAIMVREPDATIQPTPQDNQRMSKHRVLGFKPQLRLEWRGQHGQNETEQPDQSASIGDSITSSTRKGFRYTQLERLGAQRDLFQRSSFASGSDGQGPGCNRRRLAQIKDVDRTGSSRTRLSGPCQNTSGTAADRSCVRPGPVARPSEIRCRRRQST